MPAKARWLDSLGFRDDPFELQEAEQEGARLPQLWIEQSYLDAMVGAPTRPQTAYMLAGRGAGKTATREMVAYECERGRLRGRVVVVRYCDFDLLLEEARTASGITARGHLRQIMRLALRALTESVPATYFDRLEDPKRSDLSALAAFFADDETARQLGRILHAPVVLPAVTPATNWDAYTPREVLQRLSSIITELRHGEQTRFQCLYILVDQVDESVAGPDEAAALLMPLARNRPLLETPNVAFKFFLPQEVGFALEEAGALRPDRARVCQIEWDRLKLRHMINRRVEFFSEGRLETFDQLCLPSVRKEALEQLIDAADRSPRRLLALCEALLEHHLAGGSASDYFDRKDLRDTLLDANHAPHNLSTEEPEGAPPYTSQADVRAEMRPGRGLYLDVNGQVWINGERLSKPLPRLELRLLRLLYEQAPRILSVDDLLDSVWQDMTGSESDLASSEPNLRKLVNRLRKDLEPDIEPADSRYVKNSRGRGYYVDTGRG